MGTNAVNSAICPSCANAIQFARSLPQLGGLSELQVFECRTCGLAVFGEAVAKVLESTSLPPKTFNILGQNERPANEQTMPHAPVQNQ
jgi:hypothetical protein